MWCCGEYVSNLVWILKVWNMLVVRQLVRNLVKSMVNFFSESDYSSKFLSVLGTPKYSVTLYYEFMSFHVKINRHHYALCTQCGNYGNSLSRIFGKNFVKVTVLLNKLLKSWFDEIFFGEREFLVFPHCDLPHCGNYGNLLPLKKYFVKSLI